MKTVRILIKKSSEILAQSGIENPRAEAELLLADHLNWERIDLYSKSETSLDEKTTEKYLLKIKNRAERRPAAQILGYKYFYKDKFLVTDDVLIPRPETEELVEEVLRKELPQGSMVLDLCCGTGCIGLSILNEREDIKLHLSDISPKALVVARRNAELNCSSHLRQISFYESDLFSSLPEVSYEAITCNPPYIHPDERETLAPEVREYEPEIALFHPDPEALYSTIVTQAERRLAANGALCLETAPRWAALNLEIAQKYYNKAELKRDLAGLDRYLFAIR